MPHARVVRSGPGLNRAQTARPLNQHSRIHCSDSAPVWSHSWQIQEVSKEGSETGHQGAARRVAGGMEER
jgi:hypothetical protein